MMPWRSRLALRRARVQAGLLAVVLLVSGVAATLATTLYLLDYTTTAHAARQGMDALPTSDKTLVHSVTPLTTVEEVLEGSERAAHLGLDPLPFERTVVVEGATRVVRYDATKDYVVGYLGYFQDAAAEIALIDGRWPEDGPGRTEVVVPASLLTDLDLALGDTLSLGATSSDTEVAKAEIVGTYLTVDATSDVWNGDLLAGTGYGPAIPVPNTSGLTSPAYGPFFTTLAGVDATLASRVEATYTPSFDDASLAQIARIPAHLADADTTLAQQLGATSVRANVFTPVAVSASTISSSLAMTRSSVIVTGLLLLVVAVASLSQTARLVAERRHTENHLMAARGSSGTQALTTGFLEALTLGALTVALSVPAAQYAFMTLTRVPALTDAGFHRDPGLPVGAWIVAGAVGVLLVVMLTAPLVRRSHHLVEAENTRARPSRAGLQKAGIDVALLVVAGVAFWQLSSYNPPSPGAGEVPRIDPLLTAGPALALLAGAVAVTRIVPAASRLLDLFAKRGRSAVVPLAAWEVSRRPARASAAVMLLTLAVSVGTFGLGYLATWSASQRDQALYLHPQDAVATANDAGWSEQRAAVSAEGASVTPVIMSGAEISAQSPTLLSLYHDEFRGNQAYLIAADPSGWDSLGGGRLDEVRGYAFRAGITPETEPSAAAALLPEGSQGIALTFTATPTVEELTDVIMSVRALVEDAQGERLSVDLGIVAADTKPHTVTGSLEGAPGAVSLVGLQLSVISTGEAPLQDSFFTQPKVSIEITVSDAEGLSPVEGWSLPTIPQPQIGAGFSLDALAGWTRVATGGVLDRADAKDGELTLRVSSTIIVLQSDPLIAVLTAAPQVKAVPLVASNPAIAKTAIEPGDDVSLRVGSTIVRGVLANTVPLVAGRPGPVVAADLDALQLAVFQKGGSVPEVTTWWVTTGDAAAYAAGVGPDVTVTTRDAAELNLTESPLRISIPTAVWVVIIAAAILAAIGFAVHVVVSTRARELELAQLSAVGMTRGQLVRMLTTETILLATLGAVCGLGLGAGLVTLIAPLIALGPSGGPPLPDVLVVIPWPWLGALASEVALVSLISLAIVSALTRRIHAAMLLRQGS